MSFLTRSHGMGLAAIALGVSVFLSRILGLVRDKVISYYFGAGVESDIYFTAFVVPDFLNYLLAGGYFSITLVPLISQLFHEDKDSGWQFFSAAVCWATLLIVGLTIIAWYFAPDIARYVAPGFTPEAHERLGYFLRIILPAQICFLPGACFTALLYYRKQFTVPALAPLLYNGCIIVMGLIFLHIAPERGMEGFCWGVLVGAALGSLLLPILAVRAGDLSFSPRLRHFAMKTLLALALPLMLGQSIVALDEQCIRIFGSLVGEGGVSLLSYARRITQVPVGVVAQAAGLASYPFLAALAASGNNTAFNETLARSLRASILVALPLSLWMMATATPLMRLIFQQGGITVAEAELSGILLGIMLTAVVFWAIQQILGRAFYARQDTLTPALAGTAATLFSLPVYWLGATRLGTVGVALAGVFGVVLYTSLMWGIWKRRCGPTAQQGLLKLGGQVIAVALPACAAAWSGIALTYQHLPATSLYGAALAATVSGACFICLYLGLAKIFFPALLGPLLTLYAKFRR